MTIVISYKVKHCQQGITVMFDCIITWYGYFQQRFSELGHFFPTTRGFAARSRVLSRLDQ